MLALLALQMPLAVLVPDTARRQAWLNAALPAGPLPALLTEAALAAARGQQEMQNVAWPLAPAA